MVRRSSRLRLRQKSRVEHYLYTHWTACPTCEPDATRLYDGRTNSPKHRTGQHEGEKPYWPLVGVITVDPMWDMDLDEVEEEEEARIVLHRAPFNKEHNPSYDRQELERARLLNSVTPMVVARTTRAWVRWATLFAMAAATWLLSLGLAVFILSR